MLLQIMFMYWKALELNTCSGGRCGSSHRKTVFLRAKRLRFQVLFIFVSGLHPPLSLITYCVKTSRGHFQNEVDSLNEKICFFNFSVQKKIHSHTESSLKNICLLHFASSYSFQLIFGLKSACSNILKIRMENNSAACQLNI